MIVVADTSPPLQLARIGRLDLIPAVVGRVWCREPCGKSWSRRERVLTLSPDSRRPRGSRSWRIRPFRLSAWTQARRLQFSAEQLGADALLIDEHDGRAVALTRGIAVIGTLGIVAGARRLGVLERAAPVVVQLRADGFWLADNLVAEFLKGLGESL
jgi:uncharacterized protein